MGSFTAPRIHFREWDGSSSLEGKRVLVCGTPCMGDTIQYCRFVKRVKAAGAFVIYVTHPAMVPLMKTLGCADLCIGPNDDAGDYEFWMDPFHLGLFFRKSEEIIPPIPRFPIPANRIAAFTQRIGTGSTLNVGLSWRASDFAWGKKRSIPLSLFWPLASIKGLRLFSLQRGDSTVSQEIKVFPITNLEDGPADILDTAAAMLALDLIISVDTMTAHLAGSLACPVWMLLLKIPDNRWGPLGMRTPWYPTMLLIRQPATGDWASVIQAIRISLHGLVKTRNSVATAQQVDVKCLTFA